MDEQHPQRKDKEQVTEASYTDFSNVETQRNFIFPETLPEGPYGSPVNRPLGKSTPWREGQRSYSAFNYEFKSLHQNLPRQFPGAHPTHDDPDKNEEPPYTSK
ncbi:cytosolic protein [Alkalihalobacterium chitinilyticum]|uniref:Cytosolic protein n=1 Tax=Alkalihalobacterium chitinilyticum TaxID=2980103 RepID=A0ABT5VJ38_9BACI|nr:cytosolic protein [Alkalihalobacterium chitinilyticum]MDE5415322.1 cytosolic protein [Alkalihalobacterium chitinilyticum]